MINKAEARVLPGRKWYAGGNGPEFRYSQPQNLSYQLPPDVDPCVP
jgi:hypothetical protein